MDGTSTFSSSTRRHFLHGAAAGGVVVGVGGFSAVSQWFFRGREDGGAGGLGVFQPSQAAEHGRQRQPDLFREDTRGFEVVFADQREQAAVESVEIDHFSHH